MGTKGYYLLQLQGQNQRPSSRHYWAHRLQKTDYTESKDLLKLTLDGAEPLKSGGDAVGRYDRLYLDMSNSLQNSAVLLTAKVKGENHGLNISETVKETEGDFYLLGQDIWELLKELRTNGYNIEFKLHLATSRHGYAQQIVSSSIPLVIKNILTPSHNTFEIEDQKKKKQYKVGDKIKIKKSKLTKLQQDKKASFIITFETKFNKVSDFFDYIIFESDEKDPRPGLIRYQYVTIEIPGLVERVMKKIKRGSFKIHALQDGEVKQSSEKFTILNKKNWIKIIPSTDTVAFEKERGETLSKDNVVNVVDDMGEVVCTPRIQNNGTWGDNYHISFKDLPQSNIGQKYTIQAPHDENSTSDPFSVPANAHLQLTLSTEIFNTKTEVKLKFNDKEKIQDYRKIGNTRARLGVDVLRHTLEGKKKLIVFSLKGLGPNSLFKNGFQKFTLDQNYKYQSNDIFRLSYYQPGNKRVILRLEAYFNPPRAKFQSRKNAEHGDAKASDWGLVEKGKYNFKRGLGFLSTAASTISWGSSAIANAFPAGDAKEYVLATFVNQNTNPDQPRKQKSRVTSSVASHSPSPDTPPRSSRNKISLPELTSQTFTPSLPALPASSDSQENTSESSLDGRSVNWNPAPAQALPPKRGTASPSPKPQTPPPKRKPKTASTQQTHMLRRGRSKPTKPAAEALTPSSPESPQQRVTRRTPKTPKATTTQSPKKSKTASNPSAQYVQFKDINDKFNIKAEQAFKYLKDHGYDSGTYFMAWRGHMYKYEGPEKYVYEGQLKKNSKNSKNSKMQQLITTLGDPDVVTLEQENEQK